MPVTNTAAAMPSLAPPLLLLGLSAAVASAGASPPAQPAPAPDSVAQILSRIAPPAIAARDFLVPRGADANAAINGAIDKAHDAGGARLPAPRALLESCSSLCPPPQTSRMRSKTGITMSPFFSLYTLH